MKSLARRLLVLGLLLPVQVNESAFSADAGPGLAGSKPNIVLILTDDQGFPPVGAHGHPWLKTPNLDQLYGASTRFSRFLVAPTCAPTRSALMTGRDPMKNGVTHTILERERMTLTATTLPQVLKTKGYRSGIFGKWHLGDEDAYQPGRRGFDEVFIHGAGGIGQAYDCSCADVPGNKYFNPVVRHNGKFVQTDGFCTDVFFSAAMGWIRSMKESGTPFFVYLTPNAPHGPYFAPEKNAKRFTDLGFSADTAGFYGMIENIDDNVGRLLAKLAEWRLDESTVVIFMSDNGMTGGGSGRLNQPLAEGFPFFNAGMKGLKGSADEGGVRVPFYLRWPGRIAPGREIAAVAAHFDLFPTLAALAGAAVPGDQVEGRSLVPLLENPAAPWPDRYLFTHVGRWPTGANPDDFRDVNYAVRNHRFRLVGPAGKAGKAAGAEPKAALYDMSADPGQTKNVIDQYPEIASQMRQAYEAYWKECRPLLVNEIAPMSARRPYWVAYESQKAGEGIPSWQSPRLDP